MDRRSKVGDRAIPALWPRRGAARGFRARTRSRPTEILRGKASRLGQNRRAPPRGRYFDCASSSGITHALFARARHRREADAAQTAPTIVGRTPIYSLYGASFQPTREMLSRIDVIAVDLQDVGVRPFTYTSTMSHVMRAAREAGKPVVILDRPNPMGGLIVDGPVLETWLRSFIGMHAIPSYRERSASCIALQCAFGTAS